MIDRERVLAKLDELDGYLTELRSIAPEQRVEKKRACERLLQASVAPQIYDLLVGATGINSSGWPRPAFLLTAPSVLPIFAPL